MSISEPIKLDPPEELKALGLSSIVIQGNNLLIDYNQKKIICSFFKDHWERTKKSIEKTLQSESADPKLAIYLVPWLGQEYIKLISAPSENKQEIERNSIIDKIEKERAASANISYDEWRAKLYKKYENLRLVTGKNLPNL